MTSSRSVPSPSRLPGRGGRRSRYITSMLAGGLVAISTYSGGSDGANDQLPPLLDLEQLGNSWVASDPPPMSQPTVYGGFTHHSRRRR